MKYKYRAHLPTAFSCRFIDIPSIQDAKDGFWVDEHNQFTRDEDNKFWIPPGQITFVELVANAKF